MSGPARIPSPPGLSQVPAPLQSPTGGGGEGMVDNSSWRVSPPPSTIQQGMTATQPPNNLVESSSWWGRGTIRAGERSALAHCGGRSQGVPRPTRIVDTFTESIRSRRATTHEAPPPSTCGSPHRGHVPRFRFEAGVGAGGGCIDRGPRTVGGRPHGRRHRSPEPYRGGGRFHTRHIFKTTPQPNTSARAWKQDSAAEDPRGRG